MGPGKAGWKSYLRRAADEISTGKEPGERGVRRSHSNGYVDRNSRA